jgi:hypothetical protein
VAGFDRSFNRSSLAGFHRSLTTWLANVAGFTLQCTTNLANPSSWVPVSQSPILINNQYTMTNNLMQGNMFYRLVK